MKAADVESRAIGLEAIIRSHEYRASTTPAQSARNAVRYFLSLARSSAKAIAPSGFGSTRAGARFGSGGRGSRGPRGAPGFVSTRASPERDP